MKRSPSMFSLPARKQEPPKKTFRRCLALRVCFVLCVAFPLSPLFAAAEGPPVVPEPREVQTVGPAFRILPNLRIALAADSNTDRFAGMSLQEELRLVTGRTFPIVSWTEGGAGAIVLGRIENPAIGSLLLRHHIQTTEVGSEGDVLDVQQGEVLVAGRDAAGLFYGVQTLRQLVTDKDGAAEVHGVRVRDWPAMQYRGTQVDLSRGPVPKLEYLKRIVRTIAEFKMNQLNLYMEDAFPLEGQPLIGLLDDTLTRTDFKELVAYAAPYHVAIIPATEGCGHLHKVLRFEQYSGMAEVPRGHDLVADDSAVQTFLEQFYEQVDSVFSSALDHIGCDETHELGTGRSAGRVQQDGYASVYAFSVNRAYNLVRRHNKQAIFWGDTAVAHPEVIAKLPKDLIVATWEYFPHPSYEKWIKPFSDAGMKIIVCPWVGNTSLIIPDYDVAAYNIANFIDEGKKAGAIGVNVTVWNDDGESLFAPNWWSIVYGAANAWEQKKTEVAVFDQKFDWVFYRNSDHRLTEALKKLSSLNELLHRHGLSYVYSSDFGGTNDSLFWRDPFSAGGQGDTEKILPAASELRRIAEESFTVFATSENLALRNTDTLKYLEFAALKLDALGMRYQYLPDISQRYSRILAKEKTADPSEIDGDLFQIQGVNGPFFDLRDYTTRLRGLYSELWLSENLSSWLPNVLQLYDRNGDMWQRHIAQFDQIKWDHREGKPLPPSESVVFPLKILK
jgi:hexosaminidase